jgi:hypothetical protein
MMIANGHYLIITVKPANEEYSFCEQQNDNSIDNSNSNDSSTVDDDDDDENSCYNRRVSTINEENNNDEEVDFEIIEECDMDIVDSNNEEIELLQAMAIV